MTYEKITKKHLLQWVELANTLWPDYDKEELEEEFINQLTSPEKYRSYLCFNNEQKAIGFINGSIRTDYVEGAESAPVGYIEGIFVSSEYRKQGIAKQLVTLIEKWAKNSGCSEMGSDTYIDNKKSELFHKELGYKNVGTVIHFIKNI